MRGYKNPKELVSTGFDKRRAAGRELTANNGVSGFFRFFFFYREACLIMLQNIL